MKIGTVQRDGKALLAAEKAGGVVVLADVMPDPPQSMMDVIAGGEETLRLIASALKAATPVRMDSVRWMPPIVNPGKVLCVALNNSANKARIMKGPRSFSSTTKPPWAALEL